MSVPEVLFRRCCAGLAVPALAALLSPAWALPTPVPTPKAAATPVPTVQSTPSIVSSGFFSGNSGSGSGNAPLLTQTNGFLIGGSLGGTPPPFNTVGLPPAPAQAPWVGVPASVPAGPNPTPVAPLDLPQPMSLGGTPTPTPALDASDDSGGKLWWKKNPRLLELDAADIAPSSLSVAAGAP